MTRLRASSRVQALFILTQGKQGQQLNCRGSVDSADVARLEFIGAEGTVVAHYPQ